MTKDDIIRMAREAGFEIDCCSLEWHDRIERFANLITAHEREECAKLADKYMERWTADAIRARGEK
jgi:hypothetical protein